MPGATLAKLTRPRLYGTILRARLFQLLDERRSHPVLWVTGPPGAGKTSLVASYVTERRIPGIWYQVDEEDADPATFFYYLGKAVKAVAKGQPSMPVLAPENLPDLKGFARRFFRELFERLDEGSLVVLDNFQEAAGNSTWTQLIEIAAEELPDGLNLICLSRTDPPPALARQVSTGRLATLEWADLRLTLDETRQIAAVRRQISDATLTSLHERCDGWAAGLTLMLERVGRTGEIPEAVDAETREAIFNYFAGTLFDRVPIEFRHVLLCTALLPRVTPSVAEKLSGNSGARKLLDDLHRRQLFTYRRHLAKSVTRDRQESGEPTYEYHALFRAFLRDKAAEEYTPAALRRLSAAAAELLESSGDPEAAIGLYGEAEDWTSQAALIARQAPVLLRQGRGQTLRDWINALPLMSLAGHPWLSYWLGVSLIPIDQTKAIELLEGVYERLKQSNDSIGQAVVAARLIEAEHRAYTTLKHFDRWIEVLAALIGQQLKYPDLEIELRIYCSLLLALLIRNPRHPLLRSSVERLSQLLAQGPDPDQLLTAADVLLRYFDHGGDAHRAQSVIDLANPIAEDPAVMPLSRLYWWGRVADFYCRQARYEPALRALAEANRHAQDFVGHPAQLVLSNFHVFFSILRGDLKQARQLNAQARQIAPSITGVGRAMSSLVTSLIDASAGSFEPAIEKMRASLIEYREAGVFFGTIMAYLGLIELSATCASRQAIDSLIAEARVEIADTFMQHHEDQILLIEAFVEIRAHHRDRAVSLIERALQVRPESDLYMLRLAPNLFRETLGFALREMDDITGVKQWINRFQIQPGLDAPKQWPWPIKIKTLGAFTIALQDRPLVFKGKVPRKPLELLKLLVCAGVDGLPGVTIADRLWPELAADAAINNVDINVHRLRKLLGLDAAIKSSEGRVAIDASHCWVDAWAFERLVVATELTEELNLIAGASEALVLYGGHFLGEEAEQAWAVAYRTRLRESIISLVQIAGAALQNNGDARAAAKLYEKALALDNLAEPVYRQLMHCLRQQGEIAEAMKVYRRCREILSIVLGIEPSKDTQAVAASLHN
jgi:LuxR family transcriptional regulator, maltose regulon positive regulatory protein